MEILIYLKWVIVKKIIEKIRKKKDNDMATNLS